MTFVMLFQYVRQINSYVIKLPTLTVPIAASRSFGEDTEKMYNDELDIKMRQV